MKAVKYVEEVFELTIDGITLLSVEEYGACREYVPPFNDLWWLRSPGNFSKHAAVVNLNGHVYSCGGSVNNDHAVRPALRLVGLKSTNLQIGDWFRLFGHDWTVVSDTLALCNDSIGEIPFREDYEAEDASNYEASDVKKYVEGWFAERCHERCHVPGYQKVVEGFDKLCDSDEGMDALEDVLGDMAMVEFEPYEAAKAIRNDVAFIKSEETYELLNKYFIGIFGWSFETLLERTRKQIAASDEKVDEM